jgi:hypothetical protein
MTRPGRPKRNSFRSRRCPICGKRFAARAWMLAHVTSWERCRRAVDPDRLRQLDREYLALIKPETIA